MHRRELRSHHLWLLRFVLLERLLVGLVVHHLRLHLHRLKRMDHLVEHLVEGELGRCLQLRLQRGQLLQHLYRMKKYAR